MRGFFLTVKFVRRELTLAFLSLLCFILFTYAVVNLDFLKTLDEKLVREPRPFYTTLRYFTLMIFDNYGLRWVSFVALIIFSLLAYKKIKHNIFLFLPFLALLLVNGSVAFFKFFLDRSKPSSGYSNWQTSIYHSYPSGHMVNIVVIYLLAFLLIKNSGIFESKRVKPYYLMNAVLTFGFFTTSLLRNTHWLTDLIGGVFLGVALYYICKAILIFATHSRP